MISDLRGESAFGPVASRAGDERLPATTGELTGILISSRVPVEPLGIRSLRDATDGFEGAVRVPREHLLPVLDLLRRHVGPALGLVDLTALDERDDAGAGERFSVVLLLRAHDTGAEIEIRVAVPADDTLAPSTTSVFSSARILEREVHDLFGIELDGHPDLRRLLLPEDYPGFPLRRDASPEGPQVARADLGAGREPIAPAVLRAVERDGAILIDLDVEHPTPRGAFRLALAVEDGAMGSGRALAADVEIGFLHQGIEKLAESIRLPDLDRLFDSLRAIDALPSRHAVALALEALAGIEAPARGRHLRTIAAELARVASHARALARLAETLGAIGDALKLCALVADLERWLARARPATGGIELDGAELDVAEIEATGLRAGRIVERLGARTIRRGRRKLRGLASIATDDAIALGLSGPALRATGLATDVRADWPYDAYAAMPIAIATGTAGDALDRFRVILGEASRSARSVVELAASLPDGPCRLDPSDLRAALSSIEPGSEAEARVEAPGGELRAWLVAETGRAPAEKPSRLRLRPPGLLVAGALPEILAGVAFDDLELVLASFPFDAAETDR